MKQVLMILMTLCLLTPLASAEIWGVDFGMLVADGSQPSFGYSVATQFSMEPIGGDIFKVASVSAVYSDFAIQTTQEVYAVRSFIGRRIEYKGMYAGLGIGGWIFANSQGADFSAKAAQLTIGYHMTSFDIHVGGDVISHEGPDIYYPFIGVKLGI